MALSLAALQRTGLGPVLAAGHVAPTLLLDPACRDAESCRSAGVSAPKLEATLARCRALDDTKDTCVQDVLNVGSNANADPPLRLVTPPADSYLSDRLTVLVFTSPVPSHPCVEMVMGVIESLKFLPGLAECRLIVTCDGAGKVSDDIRPKKGHVTADLKSRYEDSVSNLQVGMERIGGEVHVIPERVGFGIAVRKALDLVKTPFVMLCQHDNMFVRPIDVTAVVRAMESNVDILKCVHFVSPKTSFDEGAGNKPNIKSVEDRLGRLGGGLLKCDGMDFWPMPSWLERNHICSTAHYRDFVLGPDTKIKCGLFIEETFGQKMRADLAAGGDHSKYGVFRLLDTPKSATMHVDGRTYVPVEECKRRGRREAAPFQRLEQEHQAWLAGLNNT